MLGLDAAGKTTILFKLKGNYKATIPRIGLNIETLETKTIKYTAWDLGGSMRFSSMHYRPYYQNIQGLIFVVDSTDKERID